jgi:drug/metabolite transporter (DMT)-like permease
MPKVTLRKSTSGPHNHIMTIASATPPLRHLLPSIAVAVCGSVWGVFWLPMRWFDAEGVGGAWVSLIFNAMALLSALPFLLNRRAWDGFGGQLISGLLLGLAFSLYTISLVMTDVIHAILLFYLTPVWSTIAGWLLFGERLRLTRVLAIIFGFAGLAVILGVTEGIPTPRNAGDWTALAAGVFWSAGTLRSFRYPTDKIALPVFTFALGGIVSTFAILAVTGLMSHPLAATGNMLAMMPWIVLLGLIIFVPPNFLVLWAAQRIDPGRVGILLMTEVLFGSITAALLSGETFTLSDGIGTALIIGAGFIEVLRR